MREEEDQIWLAGDRDLDEKPYGVQTKVNGGSDCHDFLAQVQF